MDQLNARVPDDLKERVGEYQERAPNVSNQSDAARDLLAAGLDAVEKNEPAPQPEIDWLQLYLVTIAATLTTVFVAAGLLAIGIGSTAFTGALLVGAIGANAGAYARARGNRRNDNFDAQTCTTDKRFEKQS